MEERAQERLAYWRDAFKERHSDEKGYGKVYTSSWPGVNGCLKYGIPELCRTGNNWEVIVAMPRGTTGFVRTLELVRL